MSNHLAFATVTAVLRELTEAAAKKAVSAAVGTHERPDLIKNEDPRVNVFLYQVTPNAAWRNADLPTRRPDGTAAQRPQAAFDLHYVFSFHGSDKDHEPQRILGSVVRVLHSQPVLSREMVRGISTGLLAASDLVDQVELVRFAPMGLNLEELSKMWSVFFQVPYKLSLAYQASVVLIEPEVAVQPALPVRARNLYISPFRQPEVEKVESQAGPGEPILPGGAVVLRGSNLRGEATRVRVGGTDVTPDADKVTDEAIKVTLPAGIPAGVQGAQVVHLKYMGTPATLHTGTESNVAPFVLSPKITNVTFQAEAGGVRPVEVTVDPPAKKDQRVVLMLNEPVPGNPKSFSAVALPRANDADPIKFQMRGLTTGLQLLARVQVDGAESPLEFTDGAYSGPKVTVP